MLGARSRSRAWGYRCIHLDPCLLVGQQRLGRPLYAPFRSFARQPAIDDDRQHADRHLDQPLRAMRDIAPESERVALFEQIALLAVPVTDLARQDVDELGAGMLEARKYLALVRQGDQEGLEHLTRSALSGQQVIGVPALGSAAHDFEALPVGHVLRIAFFSPTSCRSSAGRTPESLRERDDRFQARADVAGLETAQHAGADAGACCGDIGQREAQLFADPARDTSDAARKSRLPRPARSEDWALWRLCGVRSCGLGSTQSLPGRRFAHFRRDQSVGAICPCN